MEKAKICLDNLKVILVDVKTNWKRIILFWVGLVGAIASMNIAIREITSGSIDMLDQIIFLVGFVAPFFTLIFTIIIGVVFISLKYRK